MAVMRRCLSPLPSTGESTQMRMRSPMWATPLRMVRGGVDALSGATGWSLTALSTLGGMWVRAALSTGCRGFIRPALVVARRALAALDWHLGLQNFLGRVVALTAAPHCRHALVVTGVVPSVVGRM